MNLRRVYIKRSGGEIASEACYAAWKGFSAKGYPLDFFEWQDLKEGCLVLDRSTLVVGGTTTVHLALEQIGIQPPPPLNIPESLQSFAGRRLWQTTLGQLRQDAEKPGFQTCFVKPARETKSFPGMVIQGIAELESLAHLTEEMELQAAEPIGWLSEWRYFVQEGIIVGIAQYAGDWSVQPSPAIVQTAVNEYKSAPIAYAIDFGVAEDIETLLVEANDAYALGSHGIDPIIYATMLENRWLEITQPS